MQITNKKIEWEKENKKVNRYDNYYFNELERLEKELFGE